MVEPGTFFRHSRRNFPAGCAHPTAVANAVQAVSFVVAVVSTKNADESNIADWKGGLVGCR